MQLDESILREQLRDIGSADIIGFELSNLSSRSGEGHFRTTRDYLAHVFTARARGADQDGKPERAAVFRGFLESVQRLPDDEPIYLWTAIQQDRRVSGYSTPLRLIGVIPDEFYKIYTND